MFTFDWELKDINNLRHPPGKSKLISTYSIVLLVAAVLFPCRSWGHPSRSLVLSQQPLLPVQCSRFGQGVFRGLCEAHFWQSWPRLWSHSGVSCVKRTASSGQSYAYSAKHWRPGRRYGRWRASPNPAKSPVRSQLSSGWDLNTGRWWWVWFGWKGRIALSSVKAISWGAFLQIQRHV